MAGEEALGAIGGGFQELSGNVLESIMAWNGMKMQIAENRRAEAIGTKEFKMGFGETQRQFDQTLGLNLRSQKFSESEAKLNRLERKDERLYSRQRELQDRFISSINNSTQGRQAMTGLLGSRRA